jgi:hypothetical protein
MNENISKRKALSFLKKKLSLEELLMQATRLELINTSDLLNLRIKKSLTKDLLIKEMTHTILDTPFVALFQLPEEEIIKLKHLAYAKNYAIPFIPSYVVSPTRQIGLSDIVTIDDQNYEYITPDLAQSLKALFEKGEELFNLKKYHHERLILGLLNLYGILDFRELRELSAIYEPQLKFSDIEFAISGSYVLKSCSMGLAGKFVFISPYLDEPEHIINEINSHKTIKQARFTKDEVMNAGLWGTVMPPANQQTLTLRRELGKLLKSEEEISVFLSNCWMLTNNDHDPLPMIMEIIEKIPMKLEKVNSLMGIFMEFTNTLPRWILKGNSSQYIFEKYDRPALQKRPPKFVMRQDIPGVNVSQEDFNQMWEKTKPGATPKTGRNEPCPCGSGKKFKHCCMRN